jgi:signal transduction histidine kinase
LQLKDTFLAKYQSLSGAFEYHRVSSKQYSRKRLLTLNTVIESALPDHMWSNRYSDYKTKAYKIAYDIEPNVTIDADIELVGHILLHPVLNAIDAVRNAQEKNITVSARTVPTAELTHKQQYNNAFSAIVTIADTGHGIPQEIREKIFTDGYTTKAHGTGHGLAFVHAQVNKLGGAYELESSPKGTSLTLYLPVAEKNAA